MSLGGKLLDGTYELTQLGNEVFDVLPEQLADLPSEIIDDTVSGFREITINVLR